MVYARVFDQFDWLICDYYGSVLFILRCFIHFSFTCLFKLVISIVFYTFRTDLIWFFVQVLVEPRSYYLLMNYEGNSLGSGLIAEKIFAEFLRRCGNFRRWSRYVENLIGLDCLFVDRTSLGESLLVKYWSGNELLFIKFARVHFLRLRGCIWKRDGLTRDWRISLVIGVLHNVTLVLNEHVWGTFRVTRVVETSLVGRFDALHSVCLR